MGAVKVRGMAIGEGMPKICIPVLGESEEEIKSSLECALESEADLLEWRADWFLKGHDRKETEEMLLKLRKMAGEIPVLFTVRTKREGGEVSLTEKEYEAVNDMAVKSGSVDLVDVELFTGEETAGRLVALAHACGVKVVMSNHDFFSTPDCRTMTERLFRMKELGADLPKIAVMPQSFGDVLELLKAAEEVSRKAGPVIAMSMGKEGVLSRLTGEAFGSAVTFAAGKEASAPGQIPAADMKKILSLLHIYTGKQA